MSAEAGQAPRILVVKLGALGDVLLALPALRRLRRSLPGARIAWLVERRNAAPLAASADLDRTFLADSDGWRRAPFAPSTARDLAGLGRDLRSERFDLALDLQGLFKSAAWARWSGARERLGLPAGRTRERLSGLLLTRRAAEPRDSRHVTDLYLEAAAEAVRLLDGVPAPPEEAGLVPLTAGERAWAEETARAHGLSDFVVVNPGAAWVTKRWDPARFGAVAKRLHREEGVAVFVAHGRGEEDLAGRVVAAAAEPGVVTFASDVRQLAALLERARLFVGGDTGPYHLARMMGTPTVALFGPTDPEQNGPRSERDDVLWGRVPCSPCYGRTCPTRIECMAGIDVEAVVARARARLGATRRGGSSRAIM